MTDPTTAELASATRADLANSGHTNAAPDPMTAADLRVTMRGLGLTPPSLARILGVTAHTVRHWTHGRYQIPEGVRAEIEQIETATTAAVGSLVDALNDADNPTLTAYRDDAALWAARPEAYPLPAAWWDTVVYRAASGVPGVTITYGSAP